MVSASTGLIERFYAAFARRDGAAMAACYTPDARFSDPVFQDLRGAEPGAMWRMLTERGRDLEVHLHEHAADGSVGTAHWTADYMFSTGRKVHNDVRATFTFRDGLIVGHRDDFDLWAWTRQALGLPGVLFGWTPIVQGAVRRKARAGLDEFMAATTP